MSRYDDFYGFPKYVPVAEKKAAARKSIEKLRKKNPDISPIIIEGRSIANTWWGKEWNKNLEKYADYSNRIGRGRSYVRNGSVLDLKIFSGNVRALVQGSQKKPYEISVEISPLDTKIWNSITKECEGKIDSLQELIEGKFPKALSEIFTTQEKGLFPSPKEIKFECSCPDWAYMCKHVAAVLYGIGARLDSDPSLFFTLRNINVNDLISDAIENKTSSLFEKSKKKSTRVMEDFDVSDMFGIEVKQIDKKDITVKKPKKTTNKANDKQNNVKEKVVDVKLIDKDMEAEKTPEKSVKKRGRPPKSK